MTAAVVIARRGHPRVRRRPRIAATTYVDRTTRLHHQLAHLDRQSLRWARAGRRMLLEYATRLDHQTVRVDRIGLHHSRDHLVRVHPDRIGTEHLHLALRRVFVESVDPLPEVPLRHCHRLSRSRRQDHRHPVDSDRGDPPRPLQLTRRPVADLHPMTDEVTRHRRHAVGHQRRATTARSRHAATKRRQDGPLVRRHPRVVHDQLTKLLGRATHVHRARAPIALGAVRAQTTMRAQTGPEPSLTDPGSCTRSQSHHRHRLHHRWSRHPLTSMPPDPASSPVVSHTEPPAPPWFDLLPCA